MDIVIDFDGTCVTHEFPQVGSEIGAVEVLKEIVANGHNLILFTMRSDFNGKHYLLDAINWFKKHEIPLYGIQTNPTQRSWTLSPKAMGDLHIDDAALGCPLRMDRKLSKKVFVDWEEVRYMLNRMGVLK